MIDRNINTTGSMRARAEQPQDDMANNPATVDGTNVNPAPGSIDEDGEIERDEDGLLPSPKLSGLAAGPDTLEGQIAEPQLDESAADQTAKLAAELQNRTDENFPANEDQTPRIYGIGMKSLPGSEHSDVIVDYAAPHGRSVKRKIFNGPVTAYGLAMALIDIDTW
jgi:hypothetical protein